MGTDTDGVLNADTATVSWEVQKEATPAAGIVAGGILALSGRRYKVKEKAASGGKITLTENYAGGGLLKLCDSCVTAAAAAGTSVTVTLKADGTSVVVTAGEKLVVGGYAHEDMVVTVSTDYSAG